MWTSPEWLDKNEQDKGRSITYADELIRTSTLTEGLKKYYEDRLFSFTWGELEEAIVFLKEYQKKSLDDQFKDAIKLGDD